jgi:hypothetical protein
MNIYLFIGFRVSYICTYIKTAGGIVIGVPHRPLQETEYRTFIIILDNEHNMGPE